MEASRGTAFDAGAGPERGSDDRDEPDLFRFEDVPDEPEADRQARIRRRLRQAMVGLALVAVALLAIVGPRVWRMVRHGDATLAMPPSIGDLNRDDSAPAQATARDLVATLRAEIELDHAAAAVYSQEAGGRGRSVMLFGGTALLWDPQAELDNVLTLAEDSGDRIRDLSPVDPGPLGGSMKCGSVGAVDAPMAVCGWADHGSIAVALFPGRSASDAAALMRTLRAATLTR